MPTLQRVCERAVARELVEPRSVCGVLLYADAAGASMLRRYCLVREVLTCAGVLIGQLITTATEQAHNFVYRHGTLRSLIAQA